VKAKLKEQRTYQLCAAWAESPRCPGGQSAWSMLTVHEDVADDPKKNPEQPVLHLEIQTIRTLLADGLRATCAARTVRGLWA
jgi:hypothetical protein